MIAEELVYSVLQGLAGGRVFPDVAEEGTPLPYITYQAVGGPALNFQTGEKPSKSFVRMQVRVWATGRIEASALGEQVEDALRAATNLGTEVLGARAATYDEVTKYRGTMQDFMLFC